MANDLTGTDPSSQDGGPPYRPVQRAGLPDEWVVVSGPANEPGPAVLMGLKSEKHAQEAANTLNDLRDSPRENEVLRQMLKGEHG